MDFRLDHVALYTSELDRSIEAYKTLGLDMMLDLNNGEIFRFVFLGSGKGFQFQLEPPMRLYDYEHKWQKEHGSTYNHFCAFVDDCAAAEKHFINHGMHIEFDTSTVLFVDSLVAFDNEGLNIELLSYNGNFEFNDMDRTKKLEPYETTLQQLSFLSENPVEQAAFYEKSMGFKVVKSREDGSIFLSDNHYNRNDHDMLIKLSPVSNMTEYQKEFHGKHGSAIDHIVFISEDPKTTWASTVAKEKLFPVKAPEYDEREGCIVGWLKDPDKNYIMIREPLIVD